MIGDRCLRPDHRRGGLGEEHGHLWGRHAALAGVLGVVAAHAHNVLAGPLDWSQQFGARDRDGRATRLHPSLRLPRQRAQRGGGHLRNQPDHVAGDLDLLSPRDRCDIHQPLIDDKRQPDFTPSLVRGNTHP